MTSRRPSAAPKAAPPEGWRSLLAGTTPEDRLDHARRLLQTPVPAEAVAAALLDCTAEAVRLFRRRR